MRFLKQLEHFKNVNDAAKMVRQNFVLMHIDENWVLSNELIKVELPP